jgi:hypothetical protein
MLHISTTSLGGTRSRSVVQRHSWPRVLAVLALGQIVLLVLSAGAAWATHRPPVITSTKTSFTTPAGSTAQWQLNLRDALTHKLVGQETKIGSGTLTVATPDVPGCSFQADVLMGQPGQVLTFHNNFYSGARAKFTTCGPPPPPPSTCSNDTVVSNFNGTAIPAGDTIWFNAVFKATGVGSTGGSVSFTNSFVHFSVGGTNYTVPIPDGQITFSSATTTGTTTFNGAAWATSVPLGFGDNVWLSGAGFPVPAGGLPGGISPVTWTGDFTLTSVSSVQWQWGAAVYTQYSTSYNSLGVKPLHSTSLDSYHNGDQAGTPENFTSFVTGGARGGGGSNATGSYSPTGSCSP